MPLFPTFHLFRFVYFQENSLHFAPFCLSSLVGSSLFSTPNYPLLAPKNPLFNDYFAPLSHVFHGSKRFCIYHFSVYLCSSPRIKRHFALRLASKRTPFSTKTQCVLPQIALYLAANSPKYGANGGFLK